MSNETETKTDRNWITNENGEPQKLVQHHIGGFRYERCDRRRYKDYRGILYMDFHISTYKGLPYNLIIAGVRDALNLKSDVMVRIDYGGCYGSHSNLGNPQIIEVIWIVAVDKPSLIPSEETMKNMAPDYEKSRDAIVDTMIDMVHDKLEEELAEKREKNAKHLRDHMASHFHAKAKEKVDFDARYEALRLEVKEAATELVIQERPTVEEWLRKHADDEETVSLALKLLSEDPLHHGGLLDMF